MVAFAFGFVLATVLCCITMYAILRHLERFDEETKL